MSDLPTLPFFFGFVPTQPDWSQFGPEQADSGRNGNRYSRNMPIQLIPDKTATKTGRYSQFWPKQAEMGSSYHSSASCGLVRGKKKKKEKEEEYEKTQKKMDGRRIKVCNKMGRLNQIGADSGQNGPIPAETGTYTAKHANTANSGQNRPKWAAAAILLLNVAL